MYAVPDALAPSAGVLQAVARVQCHDPDGTVRRSFDTTATRIILAGSVTADRTRDARRQASLELANPDGSLTPTGTGDLFAEGSLVSVWRGGIVDGGPVYVPLMTGFVDSFSTDMRGQLRVALEDILAPVAQPLGDTFAAAALTSVGEVLRALWTPVLPYARFVVADEGRAIGSPLSWGPAEDRLRIGIELATSMGLEVYADRLGRIVVRVRPDPTTQATDVTFPQGIRSTVLDMERTGSARAVNVVQVVAEPTDAEPIRAEARVTDLLSPIHPDRIGIRLVEHRSAAIASESVARDTARAMLTDRALRQDTLAVSLVPRLDIDEGDVGEWESEVRSGVVGRHRIDRVTYGVVGGATDLAASRIVPLFA